MTDLADLRARVLDQSELNDGDAFAHAARTSLVMAFNVRVPDSLRVDLPSALGLRIHTPRIPSARDIGVIASHVSSAVAAIGKEITHPREPLGNISIADFDRSPAYLTSTPSGALLVSAHRGTLMGEDAVNSTSEASLRRLGNVLPAARDLAVESVLSARPGTLRAIREMADIAKSVGDLRLELIGDGETVESYLTQDQAADVKDLLSDMETRTERVEIIGRLDGMRCKRRMFYLILDGGLEISGLMDEPLVARIQGMIDEQVVATLEKLTPTDRTGRRKSPTYRLLDAHRAPPLPSD